MIKSKYIIFDKNEALYEYNAQNVFEAIDKYVLLDICDFHITIETWNKIKDTCITIEERINLVNELCDYSYNHIKRIIANYDYLYGDEISLEECEQD